MNCDIHEFFELWSVGCTRKFLDPFCNTCSQCLLMDNYCMSVCVLFCHLLGFPPLTGAKLLAGFSQDGGGCLPSNSEFDWWLWVGLWPQYKPLQVWYIHTYTHISHCYVATCTIRIHSKVPLTLNWAPWIVFLLMMFLLFIDITAEMH